MPCAQVLPVRSPLLFTLMLSAPLLFAPHSYAQQKVASATQEQSAAPGARQIESPWAEELKKYPGLADELAVLIGKLKQDVHFPGRRNESRLLPLAPSSTIAYAALSNYGDATAQALSIFRQELKESSVLRDWWQHGSPATEGPKIEDAVDKLSQFYQFLGPELVISAAMVGNEPNFLVFSEVRKPGLKQFLQQWNQQIGAKSESKFRFRVLEPQELATARDTASSDEINILLRPDFVISADQIATIRAFNANLDSSTRDFASTPFAQRILAEYRDGITSLAAVDIHRILEKSYPAAKQTATFKKSGFADTQYLIWDHKTDSTQSISQVELSFTSPRRGAAAWLADPATLGSLDFFSPKPLIVASLLLANPSQVFDELKSFNPDSKTFASIAAGEQAFGLSLKDDLLNLLTGELTFEVDAVTPTQPVWRAFLGTKDAIQLRKTLSTLVAATRFRSDSVEKLDLTFYSLEIPTDKEKTTKVTYAFSDGYLILGPTMDAVADSVQLHRAGSSLAKSQKFLATVPAGHTPSSSALFYEDPSYIANLRFGSFLSQASDSLNQAVPSESVSPIAGHIYGEKSAIREISTNATFDVAGVLVIAAIAVPNLLRSRMAANEASAVGTVRTLNTAQVTYGAAYPEKGFAHDIITMGEDLKNPAAFSPEHAGLLDPSLAGSTCNADGWCTKSGYRFRTDAHRCQKSVCYDYVAVATPVSMEIGNRSFCSASDGIIRFHAGDPLTAPISIADCKSWPALQ